MTGARGDMPKLPAAPDVERVILGAILVDNAQLAEVRHLLAPGDFHREAHRIIYGRMLDLEARVGKLDIVTLKNELARTGELEAVGGVEFVAALAAR